MLLQANALVKRVGGHVILDRAGLSCSAAEVAVVVGKNGAGKSTLLRILAGIVEPDGGQVIVCGSPLANGAVGARRSLGYVPDATDAFPDLTVSEFVKLVAALKGIRRANTTIETIQALRIQWSLDRAWGQRLGTLSFGQRKRAYVIAALLDDPPVLVLDEPSNGLDPEGVEKMLQMIEARRRERKATVLTTNDHPFLEAIHGSTYELTNSSLRSVGAD